jgi:hypothetical protein
VEALYFLFPDVEEEALRLLSIDLQSCLLKDLGYMWSAIRNVKLRGQPGGNLLLIMKRKSDWTIVSEEDEDETQTETEADYGGYDSSYDSESQWDGTF